MIAFRYVITVITRNCEISIGIIFRFEMFGSKLRSWMEAVRSRKKQHRKEKQAKCNAALLGHKNGVKWDTSSKNCKDRVSDLDLNNHLYCFDVIYDTI